MGFRFLLGACLLVPPALLAQERVLGFDLGDEVISDVPTSRNLDAYLVPEDILAPPPCILSDAETRERLTLSARIVGVLNGSAEHLAAFTKNIPKNCERSELNYYRATATALGIAP